MNHKKSEPGVSGKSQKQKSWVNPEEYVEQKKFIEEVGGQNLRGRYDLTNQEVQRPETLSEAVVLHVLKRSPEADISGLRVEVKGNEVHFYGEVDDMKEEREIKNLVKNIPGVTRVISHLKQKLH